MNQVFQRILQEIKDIESEHPYKVPGNPDSYCKYNEAWSDCADRIRGIIERYRDYSYNDGWVPTAERLPADSGMVEITAKYYGIQGKPVTEYAYYSAEQKAFFEDSECIMQYADEDVIAWREGKRDPYDPDGKPYDPWNPPDEPPSDDRCILVSFSNSSLPEIACYNRDEDDGGAHCSETEYKTLSELGLFVNGWMELPKCKED